MKIESKKWLSISLFVPKCDWQLILRNGVKPFILQLCQDKMLFAFRLAFNTEFGENIRLSLQVPDEEKGTIALMNDNHFKDFFKTNQLSQSISDITNVGVFMHFSNNTIAYGLYDVGVDCEHTYISELEEALSLVILEALVSDAVDDELVLTFAMYILLDCYKILSKNLFICTEWCRYYQNVTTTLKSAELNDQFIEDNYQPLKEAANDIYSEVISIPNSNNLGWIAKWENTFSKVWGRIKKDQNAALFFAQINHIINQQLDLDQVQQLLLSAFLNKTIVESQFHSSMKV